MSNNAIQIPGFQGGDPASEKTQRIDTNARPVAAALNLDFLDLPDDHLGQTPPATPKAPPGVPQFQPQFQPEAQPAAPGPVGQIGQLGMPAAGGQGINPMDASAPSAVSKLPPDAAHLTSVTTLGGALTRGSAGLNAGRYVKMAALFLGSFVIVGGAVFYLNSSNLLDSKDYMSTTTASEADIQLDDTKTAAGHTSAQESVTGEEESLFDSLVKPVLVMLGLAEEEVPALPDKPAKAVAQKTPPKTVAPPPEDEGYADGNVDVEVRDPYRVIINEIDKDALEALNKGRREMSVIEEDGWRAGVEHKFPYQHFRTVEEMRAFRAAGSEPILRHALGDRSLWVRMTAAFALVESGVPLMASEVEQAVGRRERANLLNGFFQRFTRQNNIAERYVLKFALPLVPDAARIDILTGLVNAGDPDAELFVIAGSFDASPRVRRWSTNWLARHPGALLRIDEYRGALEAWKLTDVLSSNVALARAGDPAGRDARRGPDKGTGARRAFADRPVIAPGAGIVGASELPRGAGEGTQVEFYRRD
jgi:hypothetical protein